MHLRCPRRPAVQPPVLHANPTRIAVLEHDPADISTLGDRPGTRVICTRCGNHLVAGDGGGWAIAAAPAHEEAP